MRLLVPRQVEQMEVVEAPPRILDRLEQLEHGLQLEVRAYLVVVVVVQRVISITAPPLALADKDLS